MESSSYSIGGIVGTICGGKVSSCNNIANVSATGYTESYNTFVSGIVGNTDKTKSETIIYCYNTGDITGAAAQVAGISSNIAGSVLCCYNTGKITVKRGNTSNNSWGAGIASNVDQSGAKVMYCYNLGSAVCESGNNKIGGAVGYSTATVTNCYTLSTAISTVVMQNNGGTSTNNSAKNAADMKTNDFVTLLGGINHWDLESGQYPKLNWEWKK